MGGEHGITDCGTPAGKISGKFSNRCFADKAVAVWLQLDDQGRVRLVEECLREAGNFENVRGLDRSPGRMFCNPLYAVISQSTGPV